MDIDRDPYAVFSGETEVPGVLRTAVDAICEEQVDEMSLDRVIARALRIPEINPRPRQRRRVLVFTAALVAAVLLLGWFLVPPSANVTWAQVVEAVRPKTWIHRRSTQPNGQTSESWLCPSRGRQIWRGGKYVKFDDFEHQIGFEYYPDKNQVIRRKNPYAEIFLANARMWRDLFGFPVFNDTQKGNGTQKCNDEVVEQKKVRRGLKEFVQMTVLAKYPFSPNKPEVRLTFVVDPQTKLPYSVTNNGVESFYDFPEKGPADIYDVGVPRDAKIIDFESIPPGLIQMLPGGWVRIVEPDGKVRMEHWPLPPETEHYPSRGSNDEENHRPK
ncbi:MAG: hypothetical protein ACLQNE_35245 [Thermoguttaceae bacterium]